MRRVRKVVVVNYAPITERIWRKGSVAVLTGDRIRVGGHYFDFDERWDVTETGETL